LLKIIAGVETDYEGEAKAFPGVEIGYLQQEPELDDELTVKENILLYIDEDELTEDELTKLDVRVSRTMAALNCPPPDSNVDTLSGGERRRVALAQLLITRPTMLLLDEPTNHLDADTVNWLERFLAEYEGTVIAITHDRYFLENVAGWILEVDRGSTFPFQGNYTAWLTERHRRFTLEEKQKSAKSKVIARELEWMHTQPKGRSAKSKARVSAFNELVKQSDKMKYQPGTIVIPRPPRLPATVMTLENVCKSFDGRKLVENFNFVMRAGTIVGIIGPNGAGKSTLVRMICGELRPDSGTVKISDGVSLGFVSQHRQLDPDLTVYEEISEGFDTLDIGGGEIISTRLFTAEFNFKGPEQNKKVKLLSGGERNRVHIAKALKGRHNVIVLDEPVRLNFRFSFGFFAHFSCRAMISTLM
jgi:sulfate-transporting ATPase